MSNGWNNLRAIAITIVVGWLPASCVQGGTNHQQALSGNSPGSGIERNFAAEVTGYIPPSGVDAKLVARLKERLLEGLAQAGNLRGVSSATRDTRSQSILSFNDLGQELEWGYYSTGDYDQNGEVNVADITPIAIHFSESGGVDGFDANSVQAVIDGDGNGEINLGDITPIAINFGASTTAYNVYSSASEDDYPLLPGDANGAGSALVGTVLLAGQILPDSRRQFSLALDPAVDGFYWARPTDSSEDGTPSTMLPLVVSPNIDPVADLQATPTKGDKPMEVSFDARGSTDEDGSIVKYEFDWDGAVNGEEWFDSGADGTALHTYLIIGLYDPLVRVTDNRGGTSIAGIQVSVTDIGNDAPVADIQASPASGDLPLEVVFDASASFDGDSEIVKYEWDLDGNTTFEHDTGDVPGVTTTFYTNQEIECRVRVTDFEGLTDIATVTVSVTGVPEDWKMFGRNPQRTSLSSFTGPQSSSHSWSYQTSGAVTSSPAIGADGTVYVGSEDGRMYAINSDGTFKWSYQTSEAILSSPALDQFGNIYFGSMNGEFYAVDSDGFIRWKHLTTGQIQGNALVTVDGKVYFGSGDGNLYCFSTSGAICWQFETTGAFLSSPALGSGSFLVVGHSSGKVYGISPVGTEVWAYQTGGYVASSPAISATGMVYVGSNDGNLYALNGDGTFSWRYQTAGDIFSSPAIGSSGDIYVGSRDGYLYSVSQSGTLNWRTQLNDEVWSSPAIGSDGIVYIGSNDNRMYAVNPAGVTIWTFLTGNLVQSSPAIARDGTLYIGGEDSFLHAIGGAS